MKDRPVEQQGFNLLWVQVTTSAEYKKVLGYSLFQRRSYERDRKGAHRSFKEPVKAGRHSLRIKATF
jgi:hypothetical protein